MEKWNEYTVFELEKLSFDKLSDQQIAINLSQINKKWKFTAGSVKHKRLRLNLLKKQETIIRDATFFIKTSKKKRGLGYASAYVPLKIIKKFDIKDNDLLIFEKAGRTFFSKIKRNIRADRPNDYYSFYIPYLLISSTRFNKEIVKYLGKVDTNENYKLMNGNKIDVTYLLKEKINEKVHVAIHPFNKNRILVGNERTALSKELNRHISVSEELLQSLGFFQGEGTKGNPRRIEIVNSNSDLLNLYLTTAEKIFGIKREAWKARVIYTCEKKDLNLERDLIVYWQQKLQIPVNNFVKTKLWKGTPNAPKGSAHLYLGNMAFREIWFQLLDLSYKLLEKDANYAKWFMQGVFAADGCPVLSKGILSSVMIRIENEREGKLYQSALNKLGIYSTLSVKNRSVTVHRFSEIIKVYKAGLFILHNERNEKLKNGIRMRLNK